MTVLSNDRIGNMALALALALALAAGSEKRKIVAATKIR
jgi:hypothetical protein